MTFPRPNASPVRLWIDTDGGVDDALALACAYRDPTVRVEGISTVSGNVAARKAARNAALVQSLADADRCPVLVGASQPLSGVWVNARDIHGEDGLGGASLGHRLPYEEETVVGGGIAGVAEAMAAFADVQGSDGAIIMTGPLTNLAEALQAYPSAFERIGRIAVMGGALTVPRVRRGGSEFNFSSDMEAARQVLALAPRLTVVTLNACRQVCLRRQRLAEMVDRAPSRLADFLRRAHQHYMDRYRALEGIDGCFPHDALAVAVAAEPEFISSRTMKVRLDEGGAFPGLMRPDDTARPVEVVTDIQMRPALQWIAACLAREAPD